MGVVGDLVHVPTVYMFLNVVYVVICTPPISCPDVAYGASAGVQFAHAHIDLGVKINLASLSTFH